MAASNIVVIMDFDKTIIDCDRDNWVVDELGVTDLFNQLLPTMPWNSLMDTMMKELHSQGITIHDIEAVLKRTPIHPRIIQAIKSAHGLGSSAMFFIETILEHHGLKECFSEINTNPSFVDEEGRLRIFPLHDFNKHPHGCHHPCPPNMCKGIVIERIQADLSAMEEKKTIIYMGDGLGDFCPSLKLGDGDYMLPRKDFPVWDLICRNRKFIQAEICEWSNGMEFECLLLNLISKISIDRDNRNDNTAQLYSDCKLQTIPRAAAYEAFTNTLYVPH
ncbi:Inorganic pyrophosphatase 1 [Hibiscus syriacus]|uniref:Inorganic pyrophosphatase 1 n=1 Tax=Hibiscus syriacus TaxID=106335 RepID=A0A6A2XCC4_HIBSY|nr:Inorganic pyrophosphatase 1 [Hibiscus syriacus]